MQLLPPFPTLLSTADGEQQALYKATFPGGAERCDLSSVQAVGHREAGSQGQTAAPMCATHNTVPMGHTTLYLQLFLPTHQPDSSPVLTSAQNHQRDRGTFGRNSPTCLLDSAARCNPSTTLQGWRIYGHLHDVSREGVSSEQQTPQHSQAVRLLFSQATARRGIRHNNATATSPRELMKPKLQSRAWPRLSRWLRYFHPGKGFTDASLRLCQCPDPGQHGNLDSDDIASKNSLYLFMLCAKD